MDSTAYSQAPGSLSSLHSKIRAHPTTAAAIAGACILVIIAIVYYLYTKHSATAAAKSTFGNHSMWHNGSLHAGHGGSVDTQMTSRHYKHQTTSGSKIDKMTASGACGPNETLATVTYPAHVVNSGNFDAKGFPIQVTVPGGTATQCVSNGKAYELSDGTDDDDGIGAGCSSKWDGLATLEAQALATVGGFQYDTLGETALQKAVDPAYASGAGLSDDELNTLMHQGGSS